MRRPKSRLAILPGLTHYNIFRGSGAGVRGIPFLDETVAKAQ